MATSMSMPQCGDFMEFQEALKRMRVCDDKIVYALNTSLPTDSFKSTVDPSATCQDLYGQMQSNYSERESAIKKCIKMVSQKVEQLKGNRVGNPNDIELLKSLRKEQTKLRLLQSELNIEEVVKDRSMKLFYERCRPYYKPSDLQV